MTALVLTTTTFTRERKKFFCSFFTATNELLLGLVDEKLTSFQYPLAFFASIPHYRSTPLREVSISMVLLKTDGFLALLHMLATQFKTIVITSTKQPSHNKQNNYLKYNATNL